MINANSNTLNISTGHPIDCTAQPEPSIDIVALRRSHTAMHSARRMAVRAMIMCEQEYQNRCSTMNLLRGEHGSVSTTEGRDALRLCKALGMAKTTGKWGQWTKAVGRQSDMVRGLLSYTMSKVDPESGLARVQRHCLAKHDSALSGPTSREGAAFLSLFRSILTTLKSVSFNGSACGFASRQDGLLDSLIESANELLNYDLGGLDGGTCSSALCAIQEAYRNA